MKYHTILFDLDGTLTDPGLGITNAVMYALDKLGYPVPPRASLYKFIGPPLQDSFAQFYSMDARRVELAVRFYREYYAAAGKFENGVYSGVPAALKALKEQGCHLLVATSKPESFSVEIIEHFGLAPYFDGVCGSTMDASRCKKGQVIAYALQTHKIDPAVAVMVGDREHDVIGAKENNLPCVGVLYGYGSRAELLAAGAAALAQTPGELAEILEA